MQNNWVKKTVVIGIIFLFFGTSMQYSTQSISTLELSDASFTNFFSHFSSDNTTNYYAVIAACSEYQDPSHNIPKRPFPHFSDRKLMVFYESLLQSKNWDEHNIILLLNEKATKNNITSALQYMTNIVRPDDYFVFSWSGHGSQTVDTNGDEQNYDPKDTLDEVICPYDIFAGEDAWINMITDDELGSYFSNITCKGMTLIFDCCLSGGMVDRTGTNGYRAERRYQVSTESFSNDFQRDIEQPRVVDVNGNNRVVLMSTQVDFLERGIFLTGFPLVTGMGIACGQPNITDTDNDSIISSEEAFAVAKPLVFLQSSIYWMGFGIYFYIAAIIEQMPKAFITAILYAVKGWFLIQTFCMVFHHHFMGNIPIIQDDYTGEFPLIQL